MELAELLAREGLTPDALMPWAHARATALIADLVADVSPEHELVVLLGAGQSVELPPPPDWRSDGQPEPLLETFDTRPILLGTAEAESLLHETLLHETSTPALEVDDETTKVERAPGLAARDQTNEVTRIERSPSAPAPTEGETSDEPEEEIELDELVEIDDAELEMLEEDDPDDEASDDAAPVRSGDTASGLPIVDPEESAPVPVQTGQTAAFPTIPLEDSLDEQAPVQTGHTAAHPVIPVQSGDTAKHATLDEPIAEEDEPEDVDLDAPRPTAEPDDDFELEFD